MPLDPQARRVLEQIATLGLPPNHLVSPAQARLNAKARPRAPGPEVAKVEDRLIPASGIEIPVRIYTPVGHGPFPVLVWFHGGGWVVGDLETADPTARHLTVGAGCVVVSVDYRLAPETKFPGAADDCYAATAWVAQNGARIDGDAARIAVGGDSAGGNLAAAVALMARDRGGPPLVFQLLVYPVTARDFDTASYRRNGEGYLLTRDSMRW
jgi:acetyl esterase